MKLICMCILANPTSIALLTNSIRAVSSALATAKLNIALTTAMFLMMPFAWVPWMLRVASQRPSGICFRDS